MGNDLPDGSKLSIIQGWSGTAFKNLRVTEDGELYILLSAIFDSGVLPLKCDALGNAFMNVKAQDLAEVINRPKYGSAQRVNGYVTCPMGFETPLFTVSGKGIIYGGLVYTFDEDARITNEVSLYVDGNWVSWLSYNLALNYAGITHYGQPLYASLVDTTNNRYACGLSSGITFENSFRINYRTSAGDVVVYYQVQFALV